jgi:ribosomal protein L7/L12
VFLSVLVSVTILVLVFFITLRSLIKIAVNRQLHTLSRIDSKINLLLKHAGTDPYKDLPQEVADAVKRGEKIQAIELWRRATGVSLTVAKEIIAEVQRWSVP